MQNAECKMQNYLIYALTGVNRRSLLKKQADLGEKRRLRPEAVLAYSERKKTTVEKVI
jgi:hypothetical protein